jgi:hypothetical protein
MKTCPDLLYNRSSTSRAECRVFDLLQSVEMDGAWCAYHSLNCSEHEYKRWSELDFVLAGPEGVIVLEVKGGRIRREGGAWFYKDRFDREHRNNEGPFKQAQSGMYAMKRTLVERHCLHIPAGAVFGWGVVFPDVEWCDDTIETPSRLVADHRAMSKAALREYLRGVVRYWHSKERRPARLDRQFLCQLREKMRPDIDLVPPLSAAVGAAVHTFQTLTQEQAERLRFIETNPRVIVSGGAGTGKTYLAIQCARRESLRGRSVLFVADSPELVAWLRKIEPDRSITMTTYRDLSSISGSFEVLIVDEGQDLLSLDALDSLGARLLGRLDEGTWRWFMDDANQVGLRGSFDPEALEILESGLGSGVPTRLPLHQNIRNTRQIVEAVAAWTGADIGAPSEGTGRPPTVVGYTADSAEGAAVTNLLDELTSEGMELDQIALIHHCDSPPNFLDVLPRRIRTRLVPLNPTTAQGTLRGKMVWGPVDRFKGLERPLVICTGFRDAPSDALERAQLYVAMTRANFGLYVIVPQAAVQGMCSALQDTELNVDRRR